MKKNNNKSLLRFLGASSTFYLKKNKCNAISTVINTFLQQSDWNYRVSTANFIEIIEFLQIFSTIIQVPLDFRKKTSLHPTFFNFVSYPSSNRNWICRSFMVWMLIFDFKTQKLKINPLNFFQIFLSVKTTPQFFCRLDKGFLFFLSISYFFCHFDKKKTMLRWLVSKKNTVLPNTYYLIPNIYYR